MTVQRVKLLLAIVGLSVFFIGTRTALPWLRWAGIAFVAVAWMLRFYRPAESRRAVVPPSEEA